MVRTRFAPSPTGYLHYKAYQLSLKRVVALKMIRSHRLTDPDARVRFTSEACTVAQLDHANIVHIWESGA